jgi:glucose-6-phosphate dehydrogenase assembly protein OpcA
VGVQFTAASATELGKQLVISAEAAGAQPGRAHPSGGNFFVVGVDSTSVDEASLLAEQIASMHQARLFLIVTEQGRERLDAEVATIVSKISEESSTCSEIIRLRTSPHLTDAAGSVVRAQSVPGFGSEMFVLDWTADRRAVECLIAHVDTTMFDIRRMPEPEEWLRVALDSDTCLVDLNWVGLGIWRAMVREAFDRPEVAARFGELSGVSVNVTGLAGQNTPLVGRMLGSWIVGRLGYEPVARDVSGFECRARNGGTVTLELSVSESSNPPRIKEVQFRFGGGSAVTIRLEGGRYETKVQFPDIALSMSKPWEADSMTELLERYFLIGESTTNYSSAASRALELGRLERSF